jgi:hypothetical protein
MAIKCSFGWGDLDPDFAEAPPPLPPGSSHRISSDHRRRPNCRVAWGCGSYPEASPPMMRVHANQRLLARLTRRNATTAIGPRCRRTNRCPYGPLSSGCPSAAPWGHREWVGSSVPAVAFSASRSAFGQPVRRAYGSDYPDGRWSPSRPAWTKRITLSTSSSSSAALGGAARVWASSLS